MPSTWMTDRLRSAFLRENTLMLVLRLIRASDLSEWEILELLHSRYGATPTSREFRRLSELIVGGRYAAVEQVGGTRKLRMTKAGAKLLLRLEEEYEAIVAGFDASPDVVLTR